MIPPTPPLLGIVVPTLNEARTLPALLADLAALSLPHTLLVADGGSTDGTPEVAREAGARVISAPPGRARQMNAGAALMETPWLLFLHADSRLPRPPREALAAWLADADPRDVGHFRFRLDGAGPFWRFIEFGQRIRERVGGLPYGDQGLLVSRRLFEAVGGFPDVPILEDVEIHRRLRRAGRIRPLAASLPTSPRRYEAEGRWRVWLGNSLVLGLYLLGVSPERLARLRPLPSPAGGEERLLLIFAKLPEPGRVKTRLAEGVGAAEAARIYRAMARRIVDALRIGPWRAVLCFDPPDALPAVAEWLGGNGLEFRAQGEGDLGERLEHAFREALRRSRKAVVVGTDAPELDGEVVRTAFQALDAADLVVGPSLDGGYYLLGLRRWAPELFRDIPWSTSEVLRTTLRRAEELGLRIVLLDPLRDVDTVEDLHAGEIPGG